MPLTPGTRLGPYEIVAAIGAGGMGEVYKARDTRLDRTVAVKVLTPAFAADPVLRARFEREAKTISSLSHPHICALFDVGDNYLVMELLEGETLADRIAKGPLPIDQLLRIGIGVADALDKAHRHGIVHRDLKPGNIMLTKSGAKLLDFGLAKPAQPILHGANAPTMAKALTDQGTIVGTFQYMPPEQLEARDVDARSDIFAFGAVLYEMVTGRRAFDGQTAASVIAAVVGSEPPPIAELRPTTPPALDRIIRTCLAKDPDERWQTAHDVTLQLRWVLEGGSTAGAPAGTPKRRVAPLAVAWSVAALALLALVPAAVMLMRRQAPAGQLVNFTIETPQHTSLYPFDTKGLALSPDGGLLAFVAEDVHGTPSLYVRDLATAKVTPLAGTDDASYPFWSPDGNQIGFFAQHKLQRVDARGGSVVTLCDAPAGRGGTWNRDGVIVFAATLATPLSRIAAGGGNPQPVPGSDANATAEHWPWFLPDGKRFLYNVRRGGSAGGDLMAGSLDNSARKLILANVSNAVFAPPDRLVFSRGTVLMSQRFDPDTLAVSGEAMPLPFGNTSYMLPKQLTIVGASANGTLAFLPAPDRASRLVWVDAKGREEGEVGEAGGYEDAALSPDGKSIAVVRSGPDGTDIWLLSTADGRLSRFTFQPGAYGSPTWSHDSQTLAYFLSVGGIGQVCTRSLAGVERCPVLAVPQWQVPTDISPDGGTILAWTQTANADGDVYALTLGPTPTFMPLLTSAFDEGSATFSPDGKWIAFQSNASMRNEVYVRRYPLTSEQWQISSAGGESPVWGADGRELFYVSGDTVMRASFTGGSGASAGAVPTAGVPAVFFRIPGGHTAPRVSGSLARPMINGISADMQRFLFRLATEDGLPSIHVVLNWTKALQDR